MGPSGRRNIPSAISKEMLEALRSGDHNAFSSIYIHFWDAIYNFLNKLIGSSEEAKEMTQEIFIVLWEGRHKINPEKGIKPYLYGIARNKAMDHFDHKKVKERFGRAMQPVTDEDAPDEIAIAREMKLITRLAVNNMPRIRREVFHLIVTDGISIEEAADRLNITKAAVSTHLYHARKEIKELLAAFAVILFLP